MESNDIRRLLQLIKTLDPEEIKSNPQLAILQNYQFDDSPNLEMASALKMRFEQYRKNIGKLPLSSHTKNSYESRINNFTGWLATTDKDFSDFLTHATTRAEAVAAYKAFLLDENQAPPNTVNACLSTIDHFCSFLGVDAPRVKREWTPHHKLKALAPEDQACLLKAADNSKPQPAALIYLLLYTELRIGECWALNAKDFGADEGSLTIQGQLPRKVNIDETTQEKIRQWLHQRSNKFADRKPESALFLNPQGNRMSQVAMRKIIRKAGQRAGLGDRLYPDLLRQTSIANRLLTKQSVLNGQSNISATQNVEIAN